MDMLQVAIAKHSYVYAIGQVIRLGDEIERELAQAAMDRPTADTIRCLVEHGRGRLWLPSVIDALAEIGVITAEEILYA